MGVTVHAVVAGVELALNEPGAVAVDEGSGADGFEVAGPGQQLAGLTGPELLGLGDGLLVECLVLVEVSEVGLARVFCRLLLEPFFCVSAGARGEDILGNTELLSYGGHWFVSFTYLRTSSREDLLKLIVSLSFPVAWSS